MPKLTIQIRCRISPTRDDAGFITRLMERTAHTMEAAGITIDSLDFMAPSPIDPADGDDAQEIEEDGDEMYTGTDILIETTVARPWRLSGVGVDAALDPPCCLAKRVAHGVSVGQGA